MLGIIHLDHQYGILTISTVVLVLSHDCNFTHKTSMCDIYTNLLLSICNVLGNLYFSLYKINPNTCYSEKISKSQVIHLPTHCLIVTLSNCNFIPSKCPGTSRTVLDLSLSISVLHRSAVCHGST